MVQSFNWPAICASFWAAFQPQKLVPRLVYTSIYLNLNYMSIKKNIFLDLSAINWDILKQQHGIKAVCLDKDNTITAPYQLHAHAIISVIAVFIPIIVYF
jgi:hypothetical protein